MKPKISERKDYATTEQLRIAVYPAAQHDEVCRLLAASFRGKFGRADADEPQDARTARLLAAIWPYRREPNKLQLAAWSEDAPDAEPIGTLLLKWRPRAKPIESAESVGFSEPSLIKLMIEFGPLRTLRLLVGMAALHYTPAAEECYVEHLAVRPDCRGQGIGRKLMLHAQQYAEQAGFRTCALHVSKKNPAAIALYESLGFIKVGEERRFASGCLFREYDWLLMRKEMIE